MKSNNYKKNLIKVISSFVLLLLGASVLFAQPSSKFSAAKSYVEKNLEKYELKKDDISEMKSAGEIHDEKTNITRVYFQQELNGIEVFHGTIGVHMKGDEVFHFTNNFENELAKRAPSTTPSISAEAAISAVKQKLQLPFFEGTPILQPATGINQSMVFSKGNIAAQDIPVKLVYKKSTSGNLHLCWQVEWYETNQLHYWLMFVDAETSKIIEKRDLVISCDFGGTPMATDAPSCTHDHHAHTKFKNAVELPAIPKAANNLAFMPSPSGPHSYRVYAEPIEAPNEPGAAVSDVVTDGDPVASPYGWLSTDGTTDNNVTIGNNVQARNNVGPVSPPGTLPDHPAPATNLVAPYEFHHDADLTMGPETYTDAAIVNLFYWNNIVHDIFYQFGFDEVNGNFQTTNTFGIEDKGGLGGDHVIAEAQDGEGTNNANMLTLPDGNPPRMQMYLWASSPASDLVHLNTINGSSSSLTYQAIEAAFGTGNELDATGVTGNLVIIDANGNPPLAGADNEGCGTGQGVGLPADNQAALAGNIAIIKRGACAFVEKIMSAQLSGAVGVIVYNNTPGAGAIAMGGSETGNLITIPSVMVSFEDGQTLLGHMGIGTVNLTLKRTTGPVLLKDGDFDNGIIAHEYGHGISNRLTGPPSALGPLGGDEQGGEGWSDYFALYLTLQSGDLGAPTTEHPNGVLPDRGIGTYVIHEDITGGGIRPARYSPSMTVNPYTFKDIHKGEEITVPHGVGFIWCTMLWQMTQNIIDIVPVNNDLYHDGVAAGAGGNNIALRLIVEGLKNQPTSPTFIEMRDGILAADAALYGGAYNCAIWEAFAMRGLGLQASSGTNSLGDEFENYDLPLGTCGGAANALLEIKKSSAGVLENGNDITFDITVKNRSTLYPASNVVVTDNLSSNMTFVAATGGTFAQSGSVVTFDPITLAAGASHSFTVTVNINTPVSPLTELIFIDNMESGTANWTTSTGVAQWILTSDRVFSGTNAWFGDNLFTASNETLTLAAEIPSLPANVQLTFFHEYATEGGYDGGVIEISIDNGLTWTDLGQYMTQNQYNASISVVDNPFLGAGAYSGASGGYVETIVDLSSFVGENIKIQFRMASDSQVGGEGWWVDDVLMYINPVHEVNNVSATTTNGDPASAFANVLMLEPTSPLPVELVDFQARPVDQAIRLDWSTASEINSKGFFIERLDDDANEFTSIGFVDAKGGEEMTHYNFLDTEVRANIIYYYRLKMVDLDGTFEYSSIQSAMLEGDDGLNWTIQPNPTEGEFSIVWKNSETHPTQVKIFNIQGQEVGNFNISDTANQSSYLMDVSHLPNNIYLVHIQSGQELGVQKLIIQH